MPGPMCCQESGRGDGGNVQSRPTSDRELLSQDPRGGGALGLSRPHAGNLEARPEGTRAWTALAAAALGTSAGPVSDGLT